MKKWIALILVFAAVFTFVLSSALAESDETENASEAVEASTESEEAEAPASGSGPTLKKLFETRWYTYAVVILLIAFAAFMHFAGKRAVWDTRALTYAAVCIAVSYVLSCIRLYKFPFGGSITLLSMLPIIAFSLAQGPLKGVIVGCAYGLLQLIQDFYFAHPVQLLLDYPLAFGALGLAGFAGMLALPDRAKLPVAVLIASAARYLVHVVSGAVFFGMYAAPGQTALAYSLAYNIGYMGPDAALCFIGSLVPLTERLWKRLKATRA